MTGIHRPNTRLRIAWQCAVLIGFLCGVLRSELQRACADEPRIFPADQIEFFEQKIRPVLAKHCYECHSADAKELKGGLRLDRRSGLLKGGDSGPIVVLGKPAKSLLLETLRYETYEMPPSGKLPDNVIRDFEKWIEMGLPDPREIAPQSDQEIANKPTNDLWSLKPVAHAKPPAVRFQAWPLQTLDQFVLARLESEGLKPVGDAEPERLLRRLRFALVGLPPTVTEIDQFVSEYHTDSNAAVESAVDRLLASPHFGQRWGRHWLDVARYAESNGMAWNMSFPYAWRYRDYVIASFNCDKPFDRFVTEQLAGDLLTADSHEQKQELLTATGFLALGPKPFYEKEEEIEQNRPDWVDEQVNVVGKGLLGLTVGCARCHDHKFDPIPTRDYYAMAGIFFRTEILSGPKVGKPAVWKEDRLYDEFVHVLSPHEQVETAKEAQVRLIELEAELKQLEKTKDANKNRIEELKSAISDLKARSPRLEYAHGVSDGVEFGPTSIRIRGQWDKLGEEVPRGFLSVVKLPGKAQNNGDFKIPSHQSGRVQLAEWITHSRHPLTARVMVNRIWHHLFGRGIVSTVDNFGANGAKPTHPELLDYLAHRFVHKHHWSVKSMIREIVLSRVYRLSSRHDEANYQVDPENELLWRSRPHRLEAEAIRDAILFASGTLDLEPLNGSSVAKLNYTLLSPGDVGKIHSSRQSRHRSVYLAVLRGQETDDFFSVFDFPDPGMVKGRRETTTVPSQSLLMMNSPLVQDAAASLAANLITNESDFDARIALAFKMILGRNPTQSELRQSRQAFNAFKGEPTEKWTAFVQALFQSTEFRYVY